MRTLALESIAEPRFEFRDCEKNSKDQRSNQLADQRRVHAAEFLVVGIINMTWSRSLSLHVGGARRYRKNVMAVATPGKSPHGTAGNGATSQHTIQINIMTAPKATTHWRQSG
jgi:hypothetical protein